MAAQCDLKARARQAMLERGFHPDFPAEVVREVKVINRPPAANPNAPARDLRGLLWSSIDNDTSRDLDQVEYAERVPDGIRVKVGIADVSGSVDQGSPI